MYFPLSTGEAARLLGTTEPQLAETVRRGKVVPEPRVVAGRRLLSPDEVLQGATALGLLTDELEARIRAAAAGLADEVDQQEVIE